MDMLVLLAFIIYFIVVLGVGFYFYNKTHNMSDYVLGGRDMNPYVTAMSAQASDMSGWLLMGLPGSIYLFGMGQIWIGIGLAIGSYLAWLFVAKRLRKYSEKCNNSLTVPVFFSNRFRDDMGYIRVVTGVAILFFFTIYVASGFVAGGKLFNLVFSEIGYELAVIITGFIIVLYTFSGGFKAVCWTDFIQSIMMIIAVVVVPLVALGEIGGGWDTVSSTFNSLVENGTNLLWSGGEPITAIVLLSCLAWGLGYVGMPHILVRYMAIKNPEEVKVARRIGTLWVVVALASVGFIAVIGRVYLGNPAGFDAENVFIQMVSNLFGNSAPIIAGFLYAAILAAIMSTADSQLLVAASAITNDLYNKKGEKKIEDNRLMWMSRICVAIIAVIGVLIALSGNNNIMGLVSFAWAGFGASFGPVMVLALFWKRMNRQGALASMIVGFLTVILWNTLFISGGVFGNMFGIQTFVWDSGLYELLPAFILSLIVGVVVSRMTEEPTEDIKREFDEATAGKFY